MRHFLYALFSMLASLSLRSFVVEGDFLIQKEALLIPGDVMAIEHSPALSLYCRIVEEAVNSSWEPYSDQDIAFMRVQFALKLNELTLYSFQVQIKTQWQCYFSAKIKQRASWGAQAANEGLLLNVEKNQFALHHSDTAVGFDDAKILRAIQHDHMTRHTWPDIGYHFLISSTGICYEGRKLCFKGSHVKHHNVGNIGICLLGCFEERETKHASLTFAMLETLTDLMARLALHFGIELSDISVKGHQQFTNAKTACPGSLVMQNLKDIIEQSLAKKFALLDKF